jgi:hypothetical protein
MTPESLKRYHSKWHEIKIFFILDICFKMYSNYIFVKVLIIKNVVFGGFQSKCKSLHLFVVVFLCILAGWES